MGEVASMVKNPWRFQKGDMLAAVLVAVLAVVLFLFFLPGAEPAAAVHLYQDGGLIGTLPLHEDRQVTLTGDYTNTVTVRDGAVAITNSDCPGRDCVGCGWMDRPGRSIVCLPNALELRLVGGESDVDFVVG